MVSLNRAEEAMVRRGKIVEEIIAAKNPELLQTYLTYQNEALAARKFLDSSLIELNEEARILEVGGGILALSVQLASEGFKVTSVEPVGEGFAGISSIIAIYLDIARENQYELVLVQSGIEDCKFGEQFDFIFSINVMEHLKNPYAVLSQLEGLLKSGAEYRFSCPNYDFPYEPHFRKLLHLRRNNAFYLKEESASSKQVPESDTSGLYHSLNYITFQLVLNFCRINGISVYANKNAFFDILERAIEDQQLANRHRRLYLIVKVLYFLKLHLIAKFVPRKIQPIMDIRVLK
jgi:2-polyprenyl-3-methyl-5-hydroxy-6-metoxy-1,4-benzoquinol methylase